MKVIRYPVFVVTILFILSLSMRRLWPENPGASLGRDVAKSLVYAAVVGVSTGWMFRTKSLRANERPTEPTGEPSPHRY